MSAPVLLALLVAAQAPLGREVLPAEREVHTSADRLVLVPSTRALDLIGHARLESGGLLLRADELQYDPETQHASARGNVVFSDGLLGASALALDLDLAHQIGSFTGATLYQKGKATPAEIAAARTPEELRLVGRNEVTLRADVVRRLAPQVYEAEGIYLTPCDCRGDGWLTEPPSWSIRARRARVAAGESARLVWAQLYVKDVPTLPVPLLLLPLSNRQTGFLLPRPNYTPRNGFQLELPFFWAISRSYDATFTPGYFFGTQGDVGMRGPRLDTEFRYAPSLGTHGRFTFAAVEDLKTAAGSRRGLRGELGLSHVQDLGAGFEDRIDAAGISDQRYFRDVTADVVAQQADYLRSDGRIDHRSAQTDAFLTASYYQNLTSTPAVLATDLNPFFGPHDVNAYTFQRLPAFAFELMERTVGPLRARLGVDGVQYAPLSARPDLDCRQHDPITHGVVVDSRGAVQFDDACLLTTSREVAQRVGLTPELRLPMLLGSYVELAPYALLRADAWHVEAPQDPSRARAIGVVGATAQTELSRIFTTASGVKYRHVLEPAVELQSVPWYVGRGPDLPNDEVDAPIGDISPPLSSLGGFGGNPPATGLGSTSAGPLQASGHPLQAIVALRTRLDRKEGEAVTEPLRAEIGQGYDLLAGRPADSFAGLALQLGRFNANGEIRYDRDQRRVVGIAARGGYVTAFGSSATVGYQRLRTSLTDPMRAGLFDLVGPEAEVRPAAGDTESLAEKLDLGGHWKVSTAFALDGGVSYLPHASALPVVQRLLSYSLGVSYGSPCDCWGLRLNALFQPVAGKLIVPPTIQFLVDAHRLGGNFGS